MACVGAVCRALPPALPLGLPRYAEPHARRHRPDGGARLLVPARLGRWFPGRPARRGRRPCGWGVRRVRGIQEAACRAQKGVCYHRQCSLNKLLETMALARRTKLTIKTISKYFTWNPIRCNCLSFQNSVVFTGWLFVLLRKECYSRISLIIMRRNDIYTCYNHEISTISSSSASSTQST